MQLPRWSILRAQHPCGLQVVGGQPALQLLLNRGGSATSTSQTWNIKGYCAAVQFIFL